MSAAHHTPGPWFPTRDARWNSVCRIGRAWDISTKLPLSEFGHPDMDAHLICAAPDLLEAVRRLLVCNIEENRNIPDSAGAIRCARAAIAKATGTTHD